MKVPEVSLYCPSNLFYGKCHCRAERYLLNLGHLKIVPELTVDLIEYYLNFAFFEMDIRIKIYASR